MFGYFNSGSHQYLRVLHLFCDSSIHNIPRDKKYLDFIDQATKFFEKTRGAKEFGALSFLGILGKS